MRLFDNALSGNCYKVRLLLSHLGLEYERVPVGIEDRSERGDQIDGRSVIGRIPLLELDDGTTLAESNAIIWHLARGTPFLADAELERARTLQWLFFEQNLHEPHIATRRYLVGIVGARGMDQVLDYQLTRGTEALETMERHLAKQEFFVASGYSIADIALFAYTHVAPEGGFDLGPFGAVRAWIDRVREQPGHRRMQD